MIHLNDKVAINKVIEIHKTFMGPVGGVGPAGPIHGPHDPHGAPWGPSMLQKKRNNGFGRWDQGGIRFSGRRVHLKEFG